MIFLVCGVPLLLFVLLLIPTQAQEMQHPLTNMPPASEDASVSFYYPDHDGHGSKLPVNDVVTVLCHFSNEGDAALNVSAAMGSLNLAQDFNVFVQNFSFKPFGLVVPPNEEITLAYEFIMDPRLDTSQDYSMAHSIFYGRVDNPEDWYTSTFFNSTVELYSTEPEVDAETIGLILLALLSSAFTLTVCFYACFPTEKSWKAALASLQQKKPKEY